MASDDPDPLLTLPPDLRGAFKEPFGPVETDPERVLADVTGPLVAVGDIVTYHFERVGRTPDVAVVDGRTKREAVDGEVSETIREDHTVEVENPAASLTADLLVALRDAVADDRPTTVVVDGEEDLATLPAVVAAPDGASVVYGQPDAGMVHVRVDAGTRAEFADLLRRMDGDAERALALLEA
ncbi:GTP-dependent dephospho-CoA kinase family protein [Halostella litorea]|uniref:GTP-dependent dephospho-CoA kinase family protein n=1 Tax=Halostella litorea TaxID=2528831 RepID=UPI00109194C9|nr:GTP-dependent dephospho-CoA kinase family protein [Halostella litorea]